MSEERTPDAQRTAKARRINFEDTDTFVAPDARSEPPPPGSLAAWLAKNQQAAPAAAAPPSKNQLGPGRRGDAHQWWICCDPLPPIPLGTQSSTITIGRSPHADVVLPHTQVSRIHGKIKILGEGRYVYEDNGSSNGSFLNGEKAVSTKLGVGDVIAVGPYEIEVHSSESLEARSRTDLDGADTPGDHTRVLTQKPQAAMTGRLSEVPILEVLQGLEFNRKTGTLEIECKAGHGRLIVAEGHPIQASFDGQYHDEALIQMAGLNEGRFQFSGEVEPGEPMFKYTIAALLLEAARRQDEGR